MEECNSGTCYNILSISRAPRQMLAACLQPAQRFSETFVASVLKNYLVHLRILEVTKLCAVHAIERAAVRVLVETTSFKIPNSNQHKYPNGHKHGKARIVSKLLIIHELLRILRKMLLNI